MKTEEKLKYYLKAMETFLSKQERSRYVLDILEEYIEEGEVDSEKDFFGDGSLLLEEIREELKNVK